MAHAAAFGLMIWDGVSPGTLLNAFRLLREKKSVIVLHALKNRAVSLKTLDDWHRFFARCDARIVASVRQRATAKELIDLVRASGQTSFLDRINADATELGDQLTEKMNAAFAQANLASAVDILGDIAKSKGMSLVAKESGLARESLCPALKPGGSPEFATVLKVFSQQLGYDSKFVKWGRCRRPPLNRFTVKR